MKKQYIEPNTEVINISVTSHLMEASQFSEDVNPSDGDAGSGSYSRGGGFWDDED